eukprot:GAFH01003920.1.p2 GENE.GAFH01003920.1~~GAFH01003920.1.p2  ORF type:complete len:168 (-),score=20.28 GAFH01003920.1:87-590(-)
MDRGGRKTREYPPPPPKMVPGRAPQKLRDVGCFSLGPLAIVIVFIFPERCLPLPALRRPRGLCGLCGPGGSAHLGCGVLGCLAGPADLGGDGLEDLPAPLGERMLLGRQAPRPADRLIPPPPPPPPPISSHPPLITLPSPSSSPHLLLLLLSLLHSILSLRLIDAVF